MTSLLDLSYNADYQNRILSKNRTLHQIFRRQYSYFFVIKQRQGPIIINSLQSKISLYFLGNSYIPKFAKSLCYPFWTFSHRELYVESTGEAYHHGEILETRLKLLCLNPHRARRPSQDARRLLGVDSSLQVSRCYLYGHW